jgi:hypothetical protein
MLESQKNIGGVFCDKIRGIVDKRLNWGLLKRDVQERLQATEREKIMAQMGISVDTCLNYIETSGCEAKHRLVT